MKQKCVDLFDGMAADLSRVIIGCAGVVRCPICLTAYERTVDDAGNVSGLTLEHVIPDSVGGRETTLTCKACNNDLGSKLDAQFSKQIRVEGGLRANAWQPGKIRLRGAAEGDAGAVAEFRVDADGSFHVSATRCNDIVAERLKAFFNRKIADTSGIVLRLDAGISESRVMAAVAKAAYLGLFCDWGYQYILMPSLDRVRVAITTDGPDRERLCDVIIPGCVASFDGISKQPTRVSFEARFTGGLMAAISMINLPEHQRTYIVLLPPRSDLKVGGWDGLSRAAESLRDQKRITFELTEAVMRG
jgi:HNH endonuclease